jgi:hypothetical protein
MISYPTFSEPLPPIDFDSLTLSNHCRCKYDPTKDFAGFIFYGAIVNGKLQKNYTVVGVDGKTTTNMTTGTVFICPSKVASIKKQTDNVETGGQVHGAAFYYVTDTTLEFVEAAKEDGSKTILILDGFAIQNLELKFSSSFLNEGTTPYHNDDRIINVHMRDKLETLVEKWKNHEPTEIDTDSLNITTMLNRLIEKWKLNSGRKTSRIKIKFEHPLRVVVPEDNQQLQL